MSDIEPSRRIDDLEERIEHLRARIEKYRKAMILSRAATVAGAVTFVLVATILPSDQSVLLGVLAFTGIIGGFVWLGANKSSKQEAEVVLRRTEAERAEIIDDIRFGTIRTDLSIS